MELFPLCPRNNQNKRWSVKRSIFYQNHTTFRITRSIMSIQTWNSLANATHNISVWILVGSHKYSEIHKYFGTVNTMQPYILWQNTQIPNFLLEITAPSQKEPEVKWKRYLLYPTLYHNLNTDIHTNLETVREKHYNYITLLVYKN
jgi:hypothetical protein